MFPLFAAILGKGAAAGAAVKGAAVAGKAAATTAAKSAAVNAATTAATTGAKAAATNAAATAAKAAPLKSLGAESISLPTEKLSIGRLAEVGNNPYPNIQPSKFDELADNLKNRAKNAKKGFVDELGNKERKEPQWSKRTNLKNVLTQGGMPLQDPNAFSEQISKLRR